MDKNNLIEYADYLFRAALQKVQNITEAEDLVQDTLLAAISAIDKGKVIDNPKSWLLSVMNRRFYDKLRTKYKKPIVSIDVAAEIPLDSAVYDDIEKSDDAENIRRCLSQLTRLYREVMVRFYMCGESVKQITVELGIPESTVKSRLDTGRKHIRKEFAMEKYTAQSYAPEKLWVSISGQEGLNQEPFSLVGNDIIAMNLLIIAYEKPVTIPELAKAIGIATAYIEPIVDKLVSGELMKRAADKVYADFIIFNEDDRTATFEAERKLSKKLYKDIWSIMDEGFSEFHEQDYYKRQSPTKRIKLDSFFAVRTVSHVIMRIRDEVCGGSEPFDNYPERPNGGKWYAMGNRHSENTQNGEYNKYVINGEASYIIEDYCGLKKLALCGYDTTLGRTHQGYNDIRYIKHPMNAEEVTKMMYAIISDKHDDLPMISNKCFENIEGLINLGFLAKDESGKVICDIPVIKMNNRWDMYKLSEKYIDIISKKFHDEIIKFMRNPVRTPAHITGVPKWQRYMWCFSSFPIMTILNAKNDGLFLDGIDTAPALYIAFEE